MGKQNSFEPNTSSYENMSIVICTGLVIIFSARQEQGTNLTIISNFFSEKTIFSAPTDDKRLLLLRHEENHQGNMLITQRNIALIICLYTTLMIEFDKIRVKNDAFFCRNKQISPIFKFVLWYIYFHIISNAKQLYLFTPEAPCNRIPDRETI